MIHILFRDDLQMKQKYTHVCENDKYQSQESGYFYRGKT